MRCSICRTAVDDLHPSPDDAIDDLQEDLQDPAMKKESTEGSSLTRSGIPSTEIERTLSTLWREALGVETVGLEEDFFSLGGDSIRAAALLLRVQDVWRREIPLETFFQRPTIAGMAGAIERAMADS